MNQETYEYLKQQQAPYLQAESSFQETKELLQIILNKKELKYKELLKTSSKAIESNLETISYLFTQIPNQKGEEQDTSKELLEAKLKQVNNLLPKLLYQVEKELDYLKEKPESVKAKVTLTNNMNK